MAIAWWLSALKGSCPECGRAALFQGLLTIRPECPACGADFTNADPGDGPAVFVTLIAGAVVVPVALVLLLAFHWPFWALALVLVPLTLGLCIWQLRVAKAALYALQRLHRAGEGRQA